MQKLPLILTLSIFFTATSPCAGEESKPTQRETVTELFWPEVMGSLNTHSIASQETNPDRTSRHLIIVRSFRNCSEYTLTQEPKVDDGHVWLIEISDGKRFKKLDRSQGRGFDSIEPLLMSLAGVEVPRSTHPIQEGAAR